MKNVKKYLPSLVAGMALGSVTAQILLDACIVTLLLILIYMMVNKAERSEAKRFFTAVGIEWAFLGYFIVAVISLAVNALDPKPWIVLKRFDWVAHFYMMIWALSYVTVDLKKWFRFFCWAFLLPNLYAVWAYWYGVEVFSGSLDGDRVIGLVHSATYHAHASGVILVFFGTIFAYVYGQISVKERAFGAFCLFAMFLSVFLTMTRGIWFSVAASTLFVLAVLSVRWVAWGAVAMTAVLSAGLQWLPAIQWRFDEFLTGGVSTSIRTNLLKAYSLMIQDFPFFGVGYWDQYRRISSYWPRIGLPTDYFNSHAHNEYVHTLATVGIFGFFFYLSFVIYFLVVNTKMLLRAPNSEIKILLLACLASQIEFQLACFTDVTFEYFKIRVLILMVWAVVIMVRRRYYGDKCAS